jgi:hypothetical protein
MATTYSAAHKRFYEIHKDEIRDKRRASDRSYYERNKDRIKARVLAKYYERKANTPAVQAPEEATVPACEAVATA